TRFDFAVARYETGLLTAIDEVEVGQTPFSIYPNPAQQQAVINYELTNEKNISIQLLDINGRTIAQLTEPEKKSAGKQEQVIDFPANLQTGFYYVALISGTEEQLLKVMVVE
ncbi:MAG TPA: T9SS type A sorting domain-containing protein, partial [Chitinophagales bacterium]|nr:T9SS type A sorting domain-containing protein [Chitinophagales bacterium]